MSGRVYRDPEGGGFIACSRGDKDRKLIEIACEVLRETEKAFHISDGVRQAWVPKSQVEMHSESDPRKRSSVAVMPEWLAKDKGFI